VSRFRRNRLNVIAPGLLSSYVDLNLSPRLLHVLKVYHNPRAVDTRFKVGPLHSGIPTQNRMLQEFSLVGGSIGQTDVCVIHSDQVNPLRKTNSNNSTPYVQDCCWHQLQGWCCPGTACIKQKCLNLHRKTLPGTAVNTSISSLDHLC
jgi:hypothetical protein